MYKFNYMIHGKTHGNIDVRVQRLVWLIWWTWCNINGTCILHFKTQHSFCKKLNYHKIRDNSIVAHVVLDVRKCFIDIYVGVLENINEFWVFLLYIQIYCMGFFNMEKVVKMVFGAMISSWWQRIPIVPLDHVNLERRITTFNSWTII